MSGVELRGGNVIDTSVAVRVAGTSSGLVNDLVEVPEDFGVHTRPLRVETHSVPARIRFLVADQPGPLPARSINEPPIDRVADPPTGRREQAARIAAVFDKSDD